MRTFTLLVLLTGTVHAQPYAFVGTGEIASIVDPAGWCAARTDGPRVGTPVTVEGFAWHHTEDDGATYRGDALVTLGANEYRTGIFYYNDTDRVSGGDNPVTTLSWPPDKTTGSLWLAWDGIADPPDNTGEGYPDCQMTTVIAPLVHRLPGDANQDGSFDSADLIQVFVAGEYEDAELDNSSWATGDWNLDQDFRTDDLVVALQTGRYDQPAAAVMVPEPSAIVLVLAGLSFLTRLGASSCRRKSP